MKLFRVYTQDGGAWWGTVVVARNEAEAISDPCLPKNDLSQTSADRRPPYQVVEITYASLNDLEAAHHCPRFVWRFNDAASKSREMQDFVRRQRYTKKPVSELSMPEIVGVTPSPVIRRDREPPNCRVRQRSKKTTQT